MRTFILVWLAACSSGSKGDATGVCTDCTSAPSTGTPTATGTATGAGTTTGTATGSGTPSGTPTTGTPGGTTSGSCAFTGTWTVVNAFCGTFEIGSDWASVYGSTTLVVDGACQGTLDLTGASCGEIEDVALQDPVGVTATLDRQGIAACNPPSCTFFGTDDPCVVGQHATGPVVYDYDELQPDRIQLTGFLADLYPQCTLDLRTEWLT